MFKQQTKLLTVFGTTILITLLSLITNTSILMLLLAIALAAIYTPLPARVRPILTAQLLVGVFAVAAFLQLGTITLFIAQAKTSFFMLSFIALMGAACIAAAALIRSGSSSRLSKPSKLDVLALSVPLVICGFVWARTIIPPKNDTVSIIQSVSFGMDDSTHSSIFGDLLRSQGNLFASARLKDTMALKWHAGYPMGWHVTSATAVSSLGNTQDLPMLTNLSLYYWAKVASLFIALLSISLLFILLLDSKKIIFDKSITFSVTGMLYIGLMVVLPLYYEGFFSFMPIITTASLFAVLLTARLPREPLPIVALVSLVVVSAISWMITAPILILAYMYTLYRDNRSFNLTLLRAHTLPLAIMVFAMGAQVMLYKIINDDRSIESLAEAGGIMAPSHILLVVLLALYSYYLLGKHKDEKAKRLLPIIGASLFALLGVLIVITVKSPTISYYYYKLQSIVIIILLCFVLAKAANFLAGTKHLRFLESVVLLAIVLGLTVPGIVGYDYTRSALGRMHNYVISDQAAQSLMEGPLARDYRANNPRYVYYIDGNSSETILSSNLARSSYQSTSCDGSIFTSAYTQNYTQLVNSVRRCTNSIPLTIYTSSNLYQKMRTDFNTNQNVTIRQLNR